MVEERISFTLAYEGTAYSKKDIANVIKTFNLHEIGKGVLDFVDIYRPGNDKPQSIAMMIRRFWATEANYIDMKHYLDTKFLGRIIIER